MKYNEEFENFLHTNNVRSQSNIATLFSEHFVLTEFIFVTTDKKQAW